MASYHCCVASRPGPAGVPWGWGAGQRPGRGGCLPPLPASCGGGGSGRRREHHVKLIRRLPHLQLIVAN